MTAAKQSLPRVPTRRFGRTELQMPVFSCGGMRYQHSSGRTSRRTKFRARTRTTSKPRSFARSNSASTTSKPPAATAPPKCSLAACCPSCRATRSSCRPRSRRATTRRNFSDTFDTSMKYLGLDYVDLLSLHGINNRRTAGMIPAQRRLPGRGAQASEGRPVPIHRFLHACAPPTSSWTPSTAASSTTSTSTGTS